MIIETELLKIGKMAAREHTRYAIMSVQIEQAGRNCSICATDGRRLLLAEWEADPERNPNPEQQIKALIPAGVCAEVLKGARRHELRFDGESFKFNGSSVHAEPVVGNFPKYADILESPRGSIPSFSIDPKLFAELLKTMHEIIGNDDHGRGRLAITLGDSPKQPLVLTGETDTGIKLTGLMMPCTAKA